MYFQHTINSGGMVPDVKMPYHAVNYSKAENLKKIKI